MPLAPGQILKNRYRVVRPLARGGFGTIYRVWELNLERPLALKENLDLTPEAQRQFKREAQILFDLSHPNLPKVIDYFDVPGQGQYLVMEYVDGDDLETLRQAAGGALPEAQVLTWIEPICNALHYLHSQNPPVIHRDIKPANLKITPKSKAMLVDFGIAKVYDPHHPTTGGARAITPGYSPYEQYGQGKTDARTDIYALGATLYHLLSGVIPTESIQRIMDDPLVPLDRLNPSLSPTTCYALEKAMAMDPRQRFQSMVEFKTALYPAPAPAAEPAPAAPGQVARTAPSPQVSGAPPLAPTVSVPAPPPSVPLTPVQQIQPPPAVTPVVRSDARRLALLALFILLTGVAFRLTQERLLGYILGSHIEPLSMWYVPLAMLLAAPLWGYAADRRGRRAILVVGALVDGLLGLLMFIPAGIGWAIAGLTLLSVFYAALMPAAMAYASDLSDEKRRGSAIGLLAGALTLASLTPRFLGLINPLFIAAPAALLAAVLAFTLLKEPPGSQPPAASSFMGGTRLALSALWGVFLVAFLGLTWLQSGELFRLGIMANINYGLMSDLFLIATILSAVLQVVLLGPLIRRWSEKWLIRICLLASALVIVISIFWGYQYASIALLLVTLVLAGALAEPAIYTLISRRAPRGVGLALGLGSSVFILGSWIGPHLNNLFANLLGFAGRSILIAGVLLLTFGISFWSLKRT